jgi:hypothetical protein
MLGFNRPFCVDAFVSERFDELSARFTGDHSNQNDFLRSGHRRDCVHSERRCKNAGWPHSTKYGGILCLLLLFRKKKIYYLFNQQSEFTIIL